MTGVDTPAPFPAPRSFTDADLDDLELTLRIHSSGYALNALQAIEILRRGLRAAAVTIVTDDIKLKEISAELEGAKAEIVVLKARQASA